MTNLDCVDLLCQLGAGDDQRLFPLEQPQAVELEFRITLDIAELRLQTLLQKGFVEALLVTGINQVFQQHRVLRYLFGNPCAPGKQ